MNSLNFRTSVTGDLNSIKAKLSEALKKENFGILTEVDVSETLKNKIGAVIPSYVIYGACSPGLAKQAIELEKDIGIIMPCNVVVRKLDDAEKFEVLAVDPRINGAQFKNAKLNDLLQVAAEQLARVVADLH